MAALLDLGTTLVDDQDYNDTVHNHINHGEVITIEIDETVIQMMSHMKTMLMSLMMISTFGRKKCCTC